MKIEVKNPKGIAPKYETNKLPQDMAATALNCDVSSGSLTLLEGLSAADCSGGTPSAITPVKIAVSEPPTLAASAIFDPTDITITGQLKKTPGAEAMTYVESTRTQYGIDLTVTPTSPGTAVAGLYSCWLKCRYKVTYDGTSIPSTIDADTSCMEGAVALYSDEYLYGYLKCTKTPSNEFASSYTNLGTLYYNDVYTVWSTNLTFRFNMNYTIPYNQYLTYKVTYEDASGREGPPSTTSAKITRRPGDKITLTLGGVQDGGNDSDTVLLLDCDGADASTTFTDTSEGGTTHTVTAQGDAQVDTTYRKLGTGALLLDGTGDYLSIPTSSDFNFTNGDFTIDFWVKASDITTKATPLIASDDHSFMLFLNHATSKKLRVYLSSNGSSWDLQNGIETDKTDWVINRWYHIAMVRNSTTVKVYVDGVEDYTYTISTTALNNANGIYIGKNEGAGVIYAESSMDEIRISKGIARWTATFTPYTVAYSTDTTDNPTRTHIYRADRSTENEKYHHLVDLPYSTTSYVDSVAVNSILGRGLPLYRGYEPPIPMWGNRPDDLSQVILMPSGFHVGYKDATIYFSDMREYKHRWPSDFSITLDYDILKLMNAGNNLIVLHKGGCHVVYGDRPFEHYAKELSNKCCVSASAIGKIGEDVYYISPDGIIKTNGHSTQLITKDYFTVKDWRALTPSTMTLTAQSDRLFAFTAAGGAYNYVIDLQDGQISNIVQTDETTATFTASSFTYKSKQFLFNKPTFFCAGRVIADSYSSVSLKVYANGALKDTISVSDSGVFKFTKISNYKKWSIEVVSTSTVHSFAIAQSDQDFNNE